ncbi:Nn.00g043020.m01.CDS01 [Neocucurbitaria sp. VM-36]
MAMTSTNIKREAVTDLWACAAAQLPDDDTRNISFSQPDKVNILAELLAETEKSKQKAIDSRWKYIRKNGEVLILRDVFERIIKWINVFKQVGDIVIQYDPTHAALPWAGIAVNDSNTLASVVEGLVRIAELICRYAVVERLYLQGMSGAKEELERALVRLYAAILNYLSKVKQYVEQGTAKRILKNAILSEPLLDSALIEISGLENDASRCMALVDKNDTINDRAELKDLLNTPLQSMSNDMKVIKDGLEASKRLEIMRWLSPEPYLQHHNQVSQDVLPGTGQWLLSDAIFAKWKRESTSSILWVHGILGSGKSALASVVIDDLVKRFQAGVSPQPIFFYCSRNPAEPARSDPKAILASIARQLSSLKPGSELLGHTVELFKKKEAEGFASGPLQMEETCALIAQLIDEYQQTTIIIDALDEIDPQTRGKLLKALKQILQSSSSLVKIIVTSRNEQDLAFHLQHYPNIEVNLRRNADDIAQFVKTQTEQLILDGELLTDSSSQTEMKELIVSSITKHATGMFRWASMQLQRVRLVDLDPDIRACLDESPPDLHGMYAEIYDRLSTTPGAVQGAIFKNTLRWLLCAKRLFETTEFLAALSISLQPDYGDFPVLKNHVLKACSSFVVFDSHSQTFRLAHLSVREFLEQKEYESSVTHAFAAEVCLWTILSTNPDPPTIAFLAKLGWYVKADSTVIDAFSSYSDAHWIDHCQIAGNDRKSGRLKMILGHFISTNAEASPIALWELRLPRRWKRFFKRLELNHEMLSDIPPALISSCSFDFPEIIRDYVDEVYSKQAIRELLNASIRSGSCRSLEALVQKFRPDVLITEDMMQQAAMHETRSNELMSVIFDYFGEESLNITEKVIEAAADNWKDGPKLMELLLAHSVEKIPVTLGMVHAAAQNPRTGEAVMKLLITHCVFDITEEIIMVVAKYSSNIGIMEYLLRQFGDKFYVTERILVAASENMGHAHELLELLLKNCHSGFEITEDVLKAAAGNIWCGQRVMEVLLDCGGSGVKITEQVLKKVAGKEGFDREELLELLIRRRGNEVKNTEEVLEAAVKNYRNGTKIIRLLQQHQQITVTYRVLAAATLDDLEEKLRILNEWADDACDMKRWINLAQLYRAVISGHSASVRQLVELGTSLNCSDNYEAKVMWNAASFGHTEVLEVLLATTAVNIDSQDNTGASPLFYAVHLGNAEMVRVLLKHGAQWDLKNNYGESPRDMARFAKSPIRQILEEAEAVESKE